MSRFNFRCSPVRSNSSVRSKLRLAAKPVVECLEDRRLLSAGQLGPIFQPTTTNFGATDTAHGVAVEPDGSIIVAGSWDGGQSDFAVAHYEPDGSLDKNVGGGANGYGSGLTNATFGTGSEFAGADHANAVAVQSDGKIVVVGYTDVGANGNNANNFAIARFNSDGSLDTTFNGTGKTTIDFGYDDRATSVAIQSNGKIVVGGYDDGGSADFAVARLNTNGSLDTSFGNAGKFTHDFGDHDYCEGLALGYDGTIVMVGYTDAAVQGTNDFAILRLTANGKPDPAFNGTGMQTVAFPASAMAQSVAIQFGKIVVAGSYQAFPSYNEFALVRLNTDGSLDTSFGGGTLKPGRAIYSFGNDDTGQAVAIQSDGKIIVAGTSENPGAAGGDFAVARFNEGGAIDTTFGSGGGATYSSGGTDTAYGVAIAGDGDIYVAGTTDGDFKTICLQSGEYSFTGEIPVTGVTLQAAYFDNGGQGVSYNMNHLTNDGLQYRADGVDLEDSPNAHADVVGEFGNNEWLQYTIDVATSGNSPRRRPRQVPSESPTMGPRK